MKLFFFFFSSRRRHTRLQGDWSSDGCSSDLAAESALCDGLEGRLDRPTLRDAGGGLSQSGGLPCSLVALRHVVCGDHEELPTLEAEHGGRQLSLYSGAVWPVCNGGPRLGAPTSSSVQEFAVGLPLLLWQERETVPAQQLIKPIPQHLARCRVGVDDATIAVQDADPIRRAPDQRGPEIGPEALSFHGQLPGVGNDLHSPVAAYLTTSISAPRSIHASAQSPNVPPVASRHHAQMRDFVLPHLGANSGPKPALVMFA